jgi:hypothetical protein
MTLWSWHKCVSTCAKEIGKQNFSKKILHFGKSGLGFLDILFSDFLLRKDSHMCGTDSPYSPYD